MSGPHSMAGASMPSPHFGKHNALRGPRLCWWQLLVVVLLLNWLGLHVWVAVHLVENSDQMLDGRFNPLSEESTYSSIHSIFTTPPRALTIVMAILANGSP